MEQTEKVKFKKAASPIDESALKELFFDQAEQMFVLCNQNLEVMEVNQATCEKFKIKKEKLLGRNIAEFTLDPSRRAKLELFKSALETGKPVSMDINVSHPDLSQLYTRIKAFKIGDHLAFLLTDITELKLMREEHKFLTNLAVSEIKHPLTRLMFLTNEALKNESMHPEAKSYFKELNREMANLDTTLHHVMDVTGSTLQNVVLEKVDMERVLENVLLMFSMNANVEEVEFQKEFTVKSDFISDVNAIFYILYELLDNSILFRKPVEFKPLIRVKFAEKEDNFILTVQDNGIGIAQSKLDNLFIFKTDIHAKPKVIGFGLFTVYKLVNKLDGVIKVKSKPRKGTTIDIYLSKNKA